MHRLAALLACLAIAIAPGSRAETLRIFAAASLKESLDEAASAFEAASGHRVLVSYAASNALARQIASGAPADLFISADTGWIDYVEGRDLVAPGSRRDLLGNELVLVAPAASNARLKLARGVDLSPALGGKRIALANPEAVPAGKYARAAFTALGMWGALEAHVAAADNVRAALALVARGEASLGVVYRTDALAEKRVRVVDAFPAVTHPPIVYPLVRLRRAPPAAAALADYLAGPKALAVFERYGFRAP
jgi:molybdate transport system substrate-binding protein